MNPLLVCWMAISQRGGVLHQIFGNLVTAPDGQGILGF